MSDASLTNLQMVRPKGPKIFLGVLALAVVAGLAWWFTRPPSAEGEPEDPRRLLVVSDIEGLDVALNDLGFEVEQGSFDALAAEGGEGEGIEAILHLADLRGFGYVVLQDPSSHGIAGIRVTADSADVGPSDPWAVFTVGELGMPPKVTVDDEASELPLPSYVQVLRAVFNQERLANTLFAEARLPMDSVELHARIKTAVDLHGGYAMLDRRVMSDMRTRSEAVVDAEEIEPKPVVLAKALEQTESIPLGDGTVLSFVQGWRLDGPWDPDVGIQPELELALFYQPPGELDPAARKRCTSLRGGVMPLGETDPTLSMRGDALLFETSRGLELWALDVNASACAFENKGRIPAVRDGEYSVGAPDRSGRLLRPADVPSGLGINLWTAGKDEPEVIDLPGCTTMAEPIWLDEDHFAVVCGFRPPPEAYLDSLYVDEEDEPPPPPPPEQTWIYVARISDQRILAIADPVLGNNGEVYPIHVVGSSRYLDLFAVHTWNSGLVHLRSEQPISAMFIAAEEVFSALQEADAKAALVDPSAEVEVDPVTGEPLVPSEPLLRPSFVPEGSMVAIVDPEQLTTDTNGSSVDPDTVVLSPDGKSLAYLMRDRHEIMVMPLDADLPTTVANNPDATHSPPRFTADGKALVFTTRYDGRDREERVGQLAKLP